jgi:HD superfamily phosphodiesterase
MEAGMALTEAQLQKIALYVRSYLMRTAKNFNHNNAEQRAANRWTHTLNVAQNLGRILEGEHASEDVRDVCLVAALFHDVDHYSVQLEYHAARGAETAQRFLKKEGYDPEFVKRVVEIIRNHHIDGDDDKPVAEQVREIVESLNLETRMVIDADTLDKIGVSNIIQSVFSMAATHRNTAQVARELTSGWPSQRASAWKDLLTTKTGQALGDARFAFYDQFLKQVEYEIVSSDPYPPLTQTQEIQQVSQV